MSTSLQPFLSLLMKPSIIALATIAGGMKLGTDHYFSTGGRGVPILVK